MSNTSWKERMDKALKEKNWDMKDWHRALSLNQWSLENLMDMDVSELNKDALEQIYNDTKNASLDSRMLRFDNPVIIAMWTHKGGTGKSTTAINLSYELASRNYNVLAIDTDSQSDLTSVLYPEYLANEGSTFYDAFMMREDLVEDDYIIHTSYTNLDIVVGSAKSEGLEGSMSTMEEKYRNKIWNKCLKGIRKTNYYDFIIIDMDKSSGLMNKAILSEADYVLSPIESPIFAIKSVPPILAQIEEVKKSNPKLELLGLLFNKVDFRKKRSFLESTQLVEELAPGYVLKNFIKNDSNIDNSQKEHMPLGVYNRSSVANKQMIDVVDELIEIIRKKKEEA